MAITFQKKEAPVSAREHDAMVAAGLIDAPKPKPKPKPKGIIIKRANQFNVGDRVVVTNDKFYWVKHYKAGDKGTITKVSTVIKPEGHTSAPVQLFHVALDVPRVLGQDVILLSDWEMSVVK